MIWVDLSVCHLKNVLRIDAVVIATPTHAHGKLVAQALNAGIAIQVHLHNIRLILLPRK